MNFLRENRVALTLITVAVILLVVGALRGEAEDVWIKAIRICMECIGLG